MAAELQQLVSPKFTEELLHDILQKETKLTNVKITNIKFGEAQKKGDSYLSTLIRFVAEGVGKDQSSGNEVNFSVPIITKSLPKNMGRRKTFRSTDFFRNEAIFYNKVWPAMQAFQDTKNVQNKFVYIPKCFAAFADGTNDFFALEDVSFQGFRAPGRQEGLDLAHTELILRVFAQFHALSLAFKDQQPQKFEEIANAVEETYFAEKFRYWYEPFQKIVFDIARDAIQKHLPKEYLDKFDTHIADDPFTKLVKVCNNPGPYSVITHGDAWIPNFLIKYDKETRAPLSEMLIDFQLARYGSLTFDISFFIYSCTDKKLRDAHWDELIEGYHTEFVKTLEELGSSPNLLTLDALKNDIKTNSIFGILISVEAVPMSLLEDSEVSDFDAIQGDEEVPIQSVWILRPYEDAKKTQRIADFIKDVIDRDLV